MDRHAPADPHRAGGGDADPDAGEAARPGRHCERRRHTVAIDQPAKHPHQTDLGLGYVEGTTFHHVVQAGATHSEVYWAQRFPDAALFLMGARP